MEKPQIMLGRAIRAERRERRATQTDLARAAGIHMQHLSKIERGAQLDVGLVTLCKIAAGLSVFGSDISASEILAAAERLSLAREGY